MASEISVTPYTFMPPHYVSSPPPRAGTVAGETTARGALALALMPLVPISARSGKAPMVR